MAKGITERRTRSGTSFLVQVRVNNGYRSKTFSSRDEAETWYYDTRKMLRGDTGDTDPGIARKTSLAEACDWGLALLDKRRDTEEEEPNDKNHRAKLRWWRDHEELGDLPMSGITKFMVQESISGMRADEGVGTQTVIHRLHSLSWLYKRWAFEHRLDLGKNLLNPTLDIKPSQPDGRDRRIGAHDPPDDRGKEDRQLLADARKSTRTWLESAIIISIETCVRQNELAQIRWRNVHLDSPKPRLFLPADTTKKTGKTRKARTVPLTPRAVAAFRVLAEQTESRNELKDRPFPIETSRGILHAWTDLIGDARARAVKEGMTAQEAELSVYNDLHWHDFRHEGVSRLFENTDLRDTEIMTITGHTSMQTMAGYAHLRGADLGSKMQPKTTLATTEPVSDDVPGTVKLAMGSDPLVLTVQSKWVPIVEVDPLTRAHAIAVIQEVADRLEVRTAPTT